MKKCPYCGKEYEDNVPRCPIDDTPLYEPLDFLPVNGEQKDWIEKSFLWLLETFGRDKFLERKTILPEPSFFPDKYDETEEAVDRVVERVCKYMDVDPGLIEVGFLVEMGTRPAIEDSDEDHTGHAGLYYPKAEEAAKTTIRLNVSLFKNPTKLIGTIAHELGHVILLDGNIISRERKDHEYLTDLLTVFYGFGIFTANSSFQSSGWRVPGGSSWQASWAGYLRQETYGYALAAYAWMRNETKPPWSKYLNMDVAHYTKLSLEFFEKGGPTTLSRLK